MKRRNALRLHAALVTTGVAGIAAVVLAGLPSPDASAATGAATGFAAQNGGTTGGAGGKTVRATTGTQIHAALCGRAASDTPIVIEVEGTINHGNTTKVSGGSCNTAADRIELKGVRNVTIVGVGAGATFDQLGIHLRDAGNVILQNLTVRNVKKSGSPLSNGGDAISMESSVRNVWADHLTLEASGGESEGYDGLFDMKDDTQFVTLSYSTLSNSGRGGLIGSSETDTGNSFITFHHNLYTNLDSRVPLLRGGVAHIYNNAYVSLNESGINSRAGAKALVENNHFKNSKDVLGTFYTSATGYWQARGNVLDNVTWSATSAENRPAGPSMASTTTVSVPYAYTLDGAACVPSIVSRTAGANRGLKVSTGNCATSAPATSAPAASSPAASSPAVSSPAPSVSTAPVGANLSLGAGADGSGKAAGTSYGHVRDGDAATRWSPNGATGSVSVKWNTATTVSRVVVQAGTTGTIGTWQLLNGDTGAILTSGTGPGTITFPATPLRKLTFAITSSTGTPSVTELETYAS